MSSSALGRTFCLHAEQSCSCVLRPTSTSQTLEELAFERGIWSAAVTGNAEKVSCLLRGGTDANARDGSGYTALVGDFTYGSIVLYCVRIPATPPSPPPLLPPPTHTQHYAARNGHMDVCTMLVEHGASVNGQTNGTHTRTHTHRHTHT